MAMISVKVLGGSLRSMEADTVGEVKAALGLESYTASVNGETRADSFELSDDNFVSLAPAVKGG